MSLLARVRRQQGRSRPIRVDLCQCGHARESHSARTDTRCTVGQAGHCLTFESATPQEIYARSVTPTAVLLPGKQARARHTLELDRTA